MERYTCLMIFIFIIQGGFSLYAVVTSLYAMTYSLYSVHSLLYVVAISLFEGHVVLQRLLFSFYAVLTAFYVVLFSVLCAVVNSLYAVPFSCRAFLLLYAVLFLLCAVAYPFFFILRDLVLARFETRPSTQGQPSEKAEQRGQRDTRRQKNPPVVTPLFMLFRPQTHPK